ncbi:uncharacterized protein LOC108631816 [Ceratina calcarata]|uniref:Uncharacterized protein LOC108631816 n=1 Tax=Ceratina calcarata TaxID=156304 RepID=A0AAJ7JEF0_9HYME|nr:uncharacterized protein LOC108631816 [Ceratina calcarata]
MPQIMVEAFARSLIDRIMLEAFDLMDVKNEELEILEDRSESSERQPESALETQLLEDRLRADYSKLETNILIEKMVHGLRKLQIGDSTSVPSHLSTLENQVKHMVHSIENVSLDPPELTEMRTIQGQGDVHQIVHDAVIETTASDLARTRPEMESDNTNEATRVSTSLLYRMIEELETRAEEANQRGTDDEPDRISKDKIAVWEEREEQFIRTIESVDDREESTTDSTSDFRNIACELDFEGTTSSSFIGHSTLFARNASLEEVAIEEITPSPIPDQECSPDASKRTKHKSPSVTQSEERKKGILSRTRKLLRTVFGRRKK